LKFPAIAEKTAKKFRGYFFATAGRSDQYLQSSKLYIIVASLLGLPCEISTFNTADINSLSLQL